MGGELPVVQYYSTMTTASHTRHFTCHCFWKEPIGVFQRGNRFILGNRISLI